MGSSETEHQEKRLSPESLHGAFVKALGDSVAGHGDLCSKPFEVDLHPPLPRLLRVYLYNATHPPGGRTMGEHKIQLIAPGHRKGQLGSFDFSDDRFVVLAGYQAEMDVFILWDAGLYQAFPHSRNVQVRAETIYRAFAGEIGQQARRLRGAKEMVLSAPAGRLGEALALRTSLTLARLLGDAS
jgi:hypothetical protein